MATIIDRWYNTSGDRLSLSDEGYLYSSYSGSSTLHTTGDRKWTLEQANQYALANGYTLKRCVEGDAKKEEAPTITKIRGELEINHERGVIYFHAFPEEVEKLQTVCVLRICRLPKPIPSVFGRSLDITHMIGTDWSSGESK